MRLSRGGDERGGQRARTGGGEGEWGAGGRQREGACW